MVNLNRPSKFEFKIESYNEAGFSSFTSRNDIFANIPGVVGYQDLTPKVMDQLFRSGYDVYKDKKASLIDGLFKGGAVEWVEDDEIRWRFKIEGEMAIRSVENLHSTDTCVGLYGGTVRMKLNIGTLTPGSVIQSYDLSDAQVVLGTRGIPDGMGYFTYEGKVNEKPGYYLPNWIFDENRRWVFIHHAAGEGSSQWGPMMSMNTKGFVEYRTYMQTATLHYTVTDRAQETMIKIIPYRADGTPIPDNEYPTKVTSLLEMQAEAELMYQQEKAICWGKGNDRSILDDSSGFYRRMGDGAFQWFGDANHDFYDPLNLDYDYMDDTLSYFWTGRVSFGNRRAKIITGTGGLKALEKMNRGHYEKGNYLSALKEFYTEGGATFDKGQRGLSGPNTFFTKTVFFPAGELEIEYAPILDDRELNGGELINNLPPTSYWLIFAYTGSGEGYDTNMKVLRSRTGSVNTTQVGTWGPVGGNTTGYNQSGSATHPGIKVFRILRLF